QPADILRAHPAVRQLADRAGERAPALIARPEAAARALVLGDVDELREADEAVGEAQRVRQREGAQQLVQLRLALGRALAVIGDRRLADRLDGAEHRLA